MKTQLLTSGDVARRMKLSINQIVRLTRHDATDTRSPARTIKLHSRDPVYKTRRYTLAEFERFAALDRPKSGRPPTK